jgi:MATE family multidrug resistance protein
MLISMGAFSFMQAMNRVFLSWLSPAALAASGPASGLTWALFCVFLGTALYTSTFVAQYFGAGKPELVGKALWAGVAVAWLGQAVVGVAWLGAERLFTWVGHAAEVRALEVEYFRISCWGVGAMATGSVLGSFYSARGQTKPAMWIGVSMSALNIALDYTLVFGHFGFPALGMAGAAWATFACQWLGALVWAALVLRRKHDAEYRVLRDFGFHRDEVVRLLRYGLPSGAHFFLDGAAWTAFSILVGNLGVITLAGSNVAWQINAFGLMPILGIGGATAILVAQFQGAGTADLAERVTRSALHLALIYMSAFAALLLGLGQLALEPFAAGAADFSAIRPVAHGLFGFVVALGFCHTVQMIYASALKGAGDVRFIMWTLALSASVGFVLPLWLLLQSGAGVKSLWGWFVLDAGVVALVFRQRFARGHWRGLGLVERGARAETGGAGAGAGGRGHE